jgi:hypothetical protein
MPRCSLTELNYRTDGEWLMISVDEGIMALRQAGHFDRVRQLMPDWADRFRYGRAPHGLPEPAWGWSDLVGAPSIPYTVTEVAR